MLTHCLVCQQLEEKFFTIPTELNQLLSGSFTDNVARRAQQGRPVDLKTIKTIKKMLTCRPTDFADCCRLGRTKFEKKFDHRIRQLLITHPADKMETFKDQDGNDAQRPFWSLPKRLPTPVVFTTADSAHIDYVVAHAMLLHKLWNMPQELLPTDANAIAIQVVGEMEHLPFSAKGVDMAKFSDKAKDGQSLRLSSVD